MLETKAVVSKICTRCLVEQPLSSYGKHPSGRLGLQPACKSCQLKMNKEWQKKNPEKYKQSVDNWHKRNPEKKKQAALKYSRKQSSRDKNRDAKLKRIYGISLEDYNKLLLAQKGCCAICLTKSKQALHVDHDHISGKVRGLLCGNCNRALGLFKDDRYSLAKAIEYLS